MSTTGRFPSDSRVATRVGSACRPLPRRSRCPSPPPRSTPRCSTPPRRVASPSRPSTSRPRRPSTPRSRASPTPAPTASSRSPPAVRSTSPARRSRTWSPARSRSRRTPPRSPRTTRSTSRCTPTTAPRTSSTASSARCSTSPPSGSRAARRRCSSRTCGTAPPCRSTRTSQIAEELLAKCAAANIILEIEVGVVGGEEDGVANEINDKLYTTPEDAIATVEALGAGENGRYMTALTFGNVHGVYKPGNVKLRPEILQDRAGGRRRRSSASAPAQALRPRLPRRLRLDRRGDRRRPSTTAW